MKLALAVVKDNIDIYNSGRLKAIVEGYGDSPKPILMSSAFHTGDNGSFKPPSPKIDSTIIVCRPKGSPMWIYLATCEGLVWTNLGNDETTVKEFIPVMARGLDRSNATSQGTAYDGNFVMKNDANCGVEMLNNLTPDEPEQHTKLFTGSGKKIEISDTASKDQILMKAGHYSSFMLTNFPNSKSKPSMGAVLDTLGPQKFINRQSKTTIAVENGSELNFINNSTGLNATGLNKLFAGNINLQTGTGDINLFTQSAGGRIFIECLPASVVLPGQAPLNDIVIRAGQAIPAGSVSTGRVIVEAAEIQLTAGKLSISAETSIDMLSKGTINMQGTSVNISSPGNVAIKGARIDLNPVTTVPPPIITNLTNIPPSKYALTGVLNPY